MAKNPPSSRLGFVGFSGGYSNVSGRLGLGPRNQAWDQAVRRVGGQLGGIERVPSRFSLFLPSDLRIGPGCDATVSKNAPFVRALVARNSRVRNSHGISSRSRSLMLARERLYSSIWEGSCRTRSLWPS